MKRRKKPERVLKDMDTCLYLTWTKITIRMLKQNTPHTTTPVSKEKEEEEELSIYWENINYSDLNELNEGRKE